MLARLKQTNIGALLAGLVLLVIGGIGAWVALGYHIGALNRFGPGFFPLVVSIGLVLFGLAIIVENRPVERDFDPPPLRSVVLVALSVLAFAFLVKTYGGVAATIALVAFASLAQDRFRPISAAVTAVVLCLLTVYLFIGELGLSMPAFPWG